MNMIGSAEQITVPPMPKKKSCKYYDEELEHCTCVNREKELEEELRIARSDIQSLKNMIVKMCYDKYGE